MKNNNYNDKIDFIDKINEHFDDDKINLDKANAINEIIVFLATGFREKNNFYIENFNVKGLYLIRGFFSSLKSNILSKNHYTDYNEFFENIDNSYKKAVKFIFSNYLNVTNLEWEEKQIYIEILKLLQS